MQNFSTTLALAAALAAVGVAHSQTQTPAQTPQSSSSSASQTAPVYEPSVIATSKLATKPPVTYNNKYEIYGAIGLQTFQAGQQLPKKMVFGNVEVTGTRWLTSKLGVAADFRGGAGTTQAFPNSDLSRPLVVQYTGMGGVQYRGPKGQFGALSAHAYAGAMHGVFDETARQDLYIGLYTNRTGPVGVVGGSIDINYSKNIAIRLSPDLMFEHLGTETREFGAISFGVVYRIGRR